MKLMQTAFEQAHDVLTQKLGEDKKIWVWGNIHRMHYTHAMSPTPLKPFFHKSYASLGTRRNLNVAGYYVNDKFAFDGLHSGNLRVLVDMGGPSYWSVDMVRIRMNNRVYQGLKEVSITTICMTNTREEDM